MSISADHATWFLVQCKPNSHQIALRNLQRQGFDTFLPLISETNRKGPRFVTRARPLFPGYIFLACDLEKGQWRAVNSTLGVTRLVSFGGRPRPVPQGLVQALAARCDASGQLRPAVEFSPGDQVMVTHGPFAQFIARIESISTDQRVWVLLKLMGGETLLEIPPDQLRSL